MVRRQIIDMTLNCARNIFMSTKNKKYKYGVSVNIWVYVQQLVGFVMEMRIT
jgi:hypothetical protein